MGNFCCGSLKSEIVEETKEEVWKEIEGFKEPLRRQIYHETGNRIRITCDDYDQDSVQSRF